jgi:hypothetical protein
VVQLLLARGADVSKKNKFGEGPVAWPSEGGFTDVVQLLRQHQSARGIQMSSDVEPAKGLFKELRLSLGRSWA